VRWRGHVVATARTQLLRCPDDASLRRRPFQLYKYVWIMTSLVVVVVNIDPSINQAECIDDLLPV
jgi:hypothetical protein